MADQKSTSFTETPEPRLEAGTPTEPARRRRPPLPGSTAEPVAEAIRGLSEGLGTLLRGHLQLARLEFKSEMGAVARDMAVEASGTPLVFVGYLLLWVAAALGMSLAMPAWAGFLIAAGINLLVGFALMAYGERRRRREKVNLPVSTSELKKDRAWANELRERPSGQPSELH